MDAVGFSLAEFRGITKPDGFDKGGFEKRTGPANAIDASAQTSISDDLLHAER